MAVAEVNCDELERQADRMEIALVELLDLGPDKFSHPTLTFERAVANLRRRLSTAKMEILVKKLF